MNAWKGGRIPAQTKYHNVKTRGYDSAKEAERARVLHLMERAGKIRDLREQVKFELIPAQYENDTARHARSPAVSAEARGMGNEPPKIKTAQKPRKSARGRCVERAVCYVADFVYTDNDTGETVVEDVKGVRTKEYVIKRKLLLWRYGIRIREV